jgi:hypothetical protein
MIEFKSFSAYCIFACSWLHKTNRAFQAQPKDVEFPAPSNSDVTINMKVGTSCCCLSTYWLSPLPISHSLFQLQSEQTCKESLWGEGHVDCLTSRFEAPVTNWLIGCYPVHMIATYPQFNPGFRAVLHKNDNSID